MMKLITATTLFLLASSGLYLIFPFEKTTKTAQTTLEPAVPTQGNPEELGAIQWMRDLEAGRAEATRTGKPILILFQEVPGCSNCTRYGNTTLSHPLIVEAIESYFVPVCIYNNKGGKDADALKRFQEPAWNNPVVRIVRSNYEDLVPRMANFNAPEQLVSGMRQALEAGRTPVPKYLQVLENELIARSSGLETATFTMYCFWSGEATFGQIEGVVETEAGFQEGREVVRVLYNPNAVQKSTLEALTQPKDIKACAGNEGFRTDREPKYYLAQTAYRFIPMTTLQACRVNSLIAQGQSPDELLSPRQLDRLQKVQEYPEKGWKKMIGRKDLAKAWAEL